MARYWFLLKRWVALLGLTATAAAVIFTVQTAALQKTLADKTLRLHVVANSDTDADQAQKLRVRDAVLGAVGALTDGCSSRAEAEQALGASLGRVQAAAQDVLTAEGCDLPVRVSLEDQRFGTRTYDTFSLPRRNIPGALRAHRRGAGTQLVVRRVPDALHGGLR